MLCRLYGLPNDSKFSVEWIPLINASVNSHIMNWPTILSDNLGTAISDYHQKRSTSTENLPPFYFSAYIMDVIYLYAEFRISLSILINLYNGYIPSGQELYKVWGF